MNIGLLNLPIKLSQIEAQMQARIANFGRVDEPLSSRGRELLDAGKKLSPGTYHR